MNRRRQVPLLLLCGLLASGCGAPGGATYVDPNDDALFAGAGSTAGATEPFATHGADVAQRATAIVRVRGALATARVLQPTDPDAARKVLARTLANDFPVLEPTLELRAPRLRALVRAHLTLLATRPPVDLAGYGASIQRAAGVELTQVSNLVVPITARQDAAFRAGILIESINDASIRYGNAVEGGLEPEEAQSEYRTAYGILLDVRTRGLDAITIDDRRKVQSLVTTAVNRSMSTPSLPDSPRGASAVSTELNLASDYIATSSGADTTLPSPDAAAPEQWRQLKRSIAAGVETWSRGDVAASRTQLRRAALDLDPAATASLASVDPGLVVTILRELDIELPTELREGGDPEPVAARLDADIDSAVTAIERELAVLRQAEDGE